MAGNTIDHPLNQIRTWMLEHEPPEIPILEFFDEGPSRLGVNEVEFKRWVGEGVCLGLLDLGGLADIIKFGHLGSEAELSDLPSEPSKYKGL